MGGQTPHRHQVLELQRAIGNRAVVASLKAATPPPGPPGTRPVQQYSVQRHSVGTELPAKGDQVQEIESKMAPSATRSKTKETTQVADAKVAGTAFTNAQKLTPGAMSLASAQKILQGRFGGLKTIVPGTVVVLADQPACAAKYDEVCMADGIKRDDGSAWKAGDCAKDDAAASVKTEGFAWKGVVYVNGATKLVTATAHEVMHNNVASGFRSQMGETFNEGFTEYLARDALTGSGITVPAETAYPDNVALTTTLATLIGKDTLLKGYFKGPSNVVDAFEKLKGKGSWALLKADAEALKIADATAKMAPNAAATKKKWWQRK